VLFRSDYQAFQLRRIYFTYDDEISEQFITRFRIEMDNGGSVDSKINPFVKDAWLKWKNVFQGSDLIFGIQPTTAYEISENAWGYRSLEKTIMDLRGVIPSRDLGVAMRGKIDDGGQFNYWLMVANGNGNKNLPKDKHRRYSATFHVKPMENFQMTLTGDYRDQAAIPNPATPGATMGNGIFTGALFAGYSEPDKFNIGVEAFMQSTANGMVVSGAPKSANSIGFSVWASANIQPDLSLVGRFDYWDPNNDASIKGDSRNLIIGSLAWKANKNVTMMPNVYVETYESAARSYDTSVTGRFTLYYIFL
jgi:hypothetical protein